MINTNINLNDLSENEKKNFEIKLDNFIKQTVQYFNKEQVEEIAREIGFVKRKSKLTGMLFLSVFVFGINLYGNPTLEQLIGLLDMYVEDLSISKPGIHKRINEESIKFFEKMLSMAMKLTIPKSLEIKVPKQFSRILIWDSTSFQLPPALADHFAGLGGSASIAGVKIQFCYDLKAHDWFYVIVEGTHSDALMKSTIIEQSQSNDLVLQDLGYYNVATFKGIESKEAFYLSRLRTDCNIYFKNVCGNYISSDLVFLINNKEFDHRLEIPVFIRGKKNIFIETRLIIERLPDSIVNARLRKLHKQAQSRGKQLSNRSIFLAQFNYYITNASNILLPGNLCQRIYAIRWQVELIFKAWKSHLKIHKTHVKHRYERIQVTLLANLIFITISSKLIGVATTFLWRFYHFEISYFRALRHFQSIAEKCFNALVDGSFCDLFELFKKAIAFIQKYCFKIPQKDRIYPLKMLEYFENAVSLFDVS